MECIRHEEQLYIEPITLQEVTVSIQVFVMPVLHSSAEENMPILQWAPGGPWKRV
jgi:hypothetical protein